LLAFRTFEQVALAMKFFKPGGFCPTPASYAYDSTAVLLLLSYLQLTFRAASRWHQSNVTAVTVPTF